MNKTEFLHKMKNVATQFRELEDCKSFCTNGTRLINVQNDVIANVNNLLNYAVNYIPEEIR